MLKPNTASRKFDGIFYKLQINLPKVSCQVTSSPSVDWIAAQWAGLVGRGCVSERWFSNCISGAGQQSGSVRTPWLSSANLSSLVALFISQYLWTVLGWGRAVQTPTVMECCVCSITVCVCVFACDLLRLRTWSLSSHQTMWLALKRGGGGG